MCERVYNVVLRRELRLKTTAFGTQLVAGCYGAPAGARCGAVACVFAGLGNEAGSEKDGVEEAGVVVRLFVDQRTGDLGSY